MAKSKLDQALSDLIEAYVALESELDEKHGDDEDSFATALVEVLETSIEAAIENQDVSTTVFASMLSTFTEALEQLDPSAFENEGEDDEEYESDDSDYDVDDDEIDLDDDDDEED